MSSKTSEMLLKALESAWVKHWYGVWSEEYPEEGSFKVLARTKAEAVKLTRPWARGWLTGRLVAERMTRKQILARGRDNATGGTFKWFQLK